MPDLEAWLKCKHGSYYPHHWPDECPGGREVLLVPTKPDKEVWWCDFFEQVVEVVERGSGTTYPHLCKTPEMRKKPGTDKYPKCGLRIVAAVGDTYYIGEADASEDDKDLVSA